jgi:hypothetical protein
MLVSTLCSGQTLQDTLPDSSKDVIILINHDRLSGEIIRGNQGSLLLDSEHAGTVSLDVEDILHLKAGNTSQFRFVFKNNPILTGGLIMDETEALGVISSAGDTLNLPMNDLIRFSRYDAQWYKRLDGYFGLGYSFTRASNLGRLNANYSIAYALTRWTFTHTLSGIHNSQLGGLERLDTDLTIVYGITTRWAIIDYLKYQKMLRLNLESRTLNIVALGHRLIVTKNVELLAASGISIQRESSSTGEVRGERHGELPVLVKFSLFDLDKPEIDFTATSVAFVGLSDRDRFRLDYSSILSYEIISDLKLGLEFYYNYDNRSFAENGPYDLGVLINVQYEF